MITSVQEMISTLLPNSTAETDMVIERFDEWHNPSAIDSSPTGVCICG